MTIYIRTIWFQSANLDCFKLFSCVYVRQIIEMSLSCWYELRLCVWGVCLVVWSHKFSRGSFFSCGFVERQSGFTTFCLFWLSFTMKTGEKLAACGACCQNPRQTEEKVIAKKDFKETSNRFMTNCECFPSAIFFPSLCTDPDSYCDP